MGRPKRIKLVLRKLGRESAVGLSYGNGLIEIDPRQTPQDLMDTIIHECLHECFDSMSEEDVENAATTIMRVLWRQNYRKVDQ